MRVGLFTDTYHPVVNGITYVIDITRRELESQGHEVYIFAPAAQIRYRETDDHIIRFKAIKSVTYRDDLTSVFFPPLALQRISRLNLAIVHIFTPNQVGLLGIMAGLKHDTPVVCQYSTDIYEYVRYYPAALKVILGFPLAAPIVLNGRLKSWSVAVRSLGSTRRVGPWLQRLTAEYTTAINDKCDAIIALSKKHELQLKAWGTTTPIIRIPTGVDPLPRVSERAVLAFRSQYGLKPKNQLILFVGRLAAEKNLELLIDAFALLKKRHQNIKLMLVGDFDYTPVLKAYAEAAGCGENIIFTGFIKRETLSVVYQAAAIFAFPSLTDTQGLVIHEAVLAGLPVVMVDDQLSEVVRFNTNGLLAKNTVTDFAAKIDYLLSHDSVRKDMAQKSRILGARFSEFTQAGKLIKLYERIRR